MFQLDSLPSTIPAANILTQGLIIYESHDTTFLSQSFSMSVGFLSPQQTYLSQCSIEGLRERTEYVSQL